MAHYRTLQSLALILGDKYKKDIVYLDQCRMKRNEVEYDFVGGTTDNDSEELVDFVKELKESVTIWLKKNHPNYLNK
jgi:site-specific DNA-adenine methylase